MRGLAIIILAIHCFLPNAGKLLFFFIYEFYKVLCIDRGLNNKVIYSLCIKASDMATINMATIRIIFVIDSWEEI